FKEGDWNRIDIIVKGTEAACQCNGEAIGKPLKLPATGVLGLQSEIGKFEFRKMQVKELKD
ncbi:MAG: family 16 glycoside hydrolase, partial [Gemmataceae bacterium]